jgi:hypothetical protein
MLPTFLSALIIAGIVDVSGIVVASGFAHARDQGIQQLSIRGIVVSFDASILTVKTREGETVAVALADGWRISSAARAGVTDIRPGDFVGIASSPKADGGNNALEVLIFPLAEKGADEGRSGTNVKSNSSLKNATVTDTVKHVNEQTVTVSYHGEEQKISVPDGTPIVSFAPATKDDLVPGEFVFIAAEKAATGTVGRQVIVGMRGVAPPI